MKYKFLLLLFSVALIALSCDNKKSHRQILLENIDDYKKEVSIDVKTYKPEHSFEQQTDTILNNGYTIKLKTYLDMDRSVVFKQTKDTINYQTHYRNFKFDIYI